MLFLQWKCIIGLFDTAWLNYLPNDKFFNLSKLKAFADDKINVTLKLKFVSERIENISEKGENAGYQHFPQMFSKAFFLRVIKSRGLCGKELNM